MEWVTKYKIVFCQNETVNLKTKMAAGIAVLADTQLEIRGDDTINIPFSTIKQVDLLRTPGGLGTMIKVMHEDGTIVLGVVRLNLFGYFAQGNAIRTGELAGRLHARSPKV